MTDPISVDAILCFHDHHQTIEACLESLANQVTHRRIMDDASPTHAAQTIRMGHHNQLLDYPYGTIFRRDIRGGPANTFNWGARDSSAEWLLYVDPHCVFQPGAVAQMLAAAGDQYEFVLGTGTEFGLNTEDAFFLALQDLVASQVPLTFLMKAELWSELHGIPEVPFCHMDAIADQLTQQGVAIAEVRGVCRHLRERDFMGWAKDYFMTGYSYGVLAREGYLAHTLPHVMPIARSLTTAQVGLLVRMVITSLMQLGCLAGLDLVPQKSLGFTDTSFQWLPTKEEKEDG